MKKIALFLGCLSFFAVPAAAPAQIEEAQAKYVPWSGYWWPHQDGGIIEPLRKYDQLTGRKAADWEKKTYPAGEDVPHWHGYCHAWSASSIMEREPRKLVNPPARSGGASVKLDIGDQKALLAACHAQDVSNFYGERNDGQEGADPQDLHPDELWRLLKLYVKQQGVPLVLDIDAGPQVWNYPVYAYRVQLTADGDDHLARMTLWFADDGVEPDFVGTKVRRESYQFRCKMRNGSVVMGSAKWVGPSVEVHPDFAWYPYVATAENPEVDHAVVMKLLQGGSVETEPRATPYEPDNPVTVTTAQPPSDPPAQDNSRRVLAIGSLELLTLVANKTSSFNFDVTVDKFDGGEYTVGESYSISGSSDKAGYLYLFLIPPPNPKKQDELGLKLLFPLAGQDNRIPAKTRFTIPGAKKGFKFVAEEPLGVHVVKAIVTTRPLSLTGVDRSQKGAAQGGQSQKLRLPPTEQTQMQQVIRKVRQGKMKPEQVEQWAGVKPDKLLGDFAQDEVPFYVGPKQKDKDKPKTKDKPKQKQNSDRDG